MKKIILFLFVFSFLFFGRGVPAEEKTEKSEIATYPGMTIQKVGDVNVLIPKGSKLRKENDLLVFESSDEYAAREFIEVDKRLKKLEEAHAAIKEELKELKKSVIKE